MTTSSSVVDVSSFTTDAKFRAWGSAVSATIVASGLTVTSDTGQINWTTVTRPTGASTKAGYEIYRFNDSLQSTAPIFLRIDYGSGGHTSGQNQSTWLTWGTGSDGAGNITGTLLAATQGNANATASTNTTLTVRASYSTAAGACFIDSGVNTVSNANAGTWLVQRTCDASGTPTGQAGTVFKFSGLSTPTQFLASFSPYAVFTSRSPAVGVLNVGSTSVSGGGVIELYRCYVTAPTALSAQGAIGYLTADIATGAVFAAAPWGSSTHNYVAMGTASGAFEQSGDSSISAAVIWE